MKVGYTIYVGFWTRLFGDSEDLKQVKDVLPELSVGDLVHLEFRHPKEVGIVSGDRLTYTRLNSAELNECKVKGSITRIWKEQNPLKSFFVEITSFDSPMMPGQPRKYLFLEEEIKEIKRV